MMDLIYKENDLVTCIETTDANNEKLIKGDVYVVLGGQVINEDAVYMVVDINGNIIYTIDRFRLLDRELL